MLPTKIELSYTIIMLSFLTFLFFVTVGTLTMIEYKDVINGK